MSSVTHSPHVSWRAWLIGSYVVIIAFFAVLWVVSLLTPVDEMEEEQQFESLEAIASTGAALIENSDVTAAQAVRSIGSDFVRTTVIAADGSVIADSSDDASSMDNHSERPEFETAQLGGTGKDRRVSTTDGIETLYLAVPAVYQGEHVVLRVSVPASDVTSFAQTFRVIASTALLVAIVLTAFVAYFAFRRTAAPVGRLERVRTNFVANASHELKTPVAGIRLLSESIERASKEGETELVEVFTERLGKESLRLQNLVTELLDLSRLESGGLAGRSHESSDLLSIASTSFEGHLTQATSKGIEFVFDDRVGTLGQCKVRLSAADASLIVDNLLENAINYTEEGSVTLSVELQGKNVSLSVADTGIGIPLAEQERIFERFYRVDTARSREMGGTGLGLSLVRHAVHRAGGTVSVKSKALEGSTFTVLLPQA